MSPKGRFLHIGAFLLLCGAPAPAWSQGDPASFCLDGQLIVVDGVQECQKIDNFAQIVADMQSLDLEYDPLRAGAEGDADALRELPDVSPETIAAYNDKMRELLARHTALHLPTNISDADQLNYDLLGFVLRQRTAMAAYDIERIPFTNDSGFFNELS